MNIKKAFPKLYKKIFNKPIIASTIKYSLIKKVLNNILEHDPLRIIIVAAHRPSVFSMCHRVYKISNGSIHEANQEEVTRFLKGDD